MLSLKRSRSTPEWFTYQNSKPLAIESKINVALIFNQSSKYKKRRAIRFKLVIKYL